MKTYYRLLLLFCLAVTEGTVSAQVKLLQVRPQMTDTGIAEIHGPHIALYDSTADARPELVFMIEGTGARALGCRKFDSCFARMGYHVISIDYPNDVITTVCSDSPDSACFDGFRQEIVFGTPVSGKVAVDSVNCIVNRLARLLGWLVEHDPQGGWGAYLEDGRPRWDRIVVAGHSQGAGHAAYLGKSYALAGVIMLSGPQDYLKVFNRVAPWQSQQGQTPASRQFAFLNLQDPFNYSFQVADVAAVTGFSAKDTTMVLAGEPVTGDRHIFVNDLDTKDHHGSTMNEVFVPVWQYIMDRLSNRRP
jgi:pimeloyl-ACP methyl ester carboxylesterase